LHFKGIEFNLGDPTSENAVKCRQDTVALPVGNYDKVYLLAASTRHDTKCTFTVGDLAQEVVIPYYGGFIGQWGHTGHTEEYLKAADIAYVGTHKHNMVHNKDLPYDFTYMFAIPLDIPAGATSLVLPSDPQVTVFAATVVEDLNNVAVSCTDLLRVGLEPSVEGSAAEKYVNLCAGKPVIGRSGQVKKHEAAEFAVDDVIETKWCDVCETMPKFIEVDLQDEVEIKGWSVLHAGVESLNYITKEYSLQVRNSPDEQWKTVDTVYDNLELQTERLLKEPVKARFVRLDIAKPDQNEGIKARIYEFVVF
jgi:alpha-mannosidase